MKRFMIWLILPLIIILTLSFYTSIDRAKAGGIGLDLTLELSSTGGGGGGSPPTSLFLLANGTDRMLLANGTDKLKIQ